MSNLIWCAQKVWMKTKLYVWYHETKQLQQRAYDQCLHGMFNHLQMVAFVRWDALVRSARPLIITS